MVYNTIGKYVCRKGTKEDIEEVKSILAPLVCVGRTPEIVAAEERKLDKHLRYYNNIGGLVIVEDSNGIVNVCLTEGNFILHVGTKRKDVVAIGLLMYTVLCDIHNRFKESTFKLIDESYRDVFDINAIDEKAVNIDKDGVGTIPISVKDKIGLLYAAIKD